MRFTYFTPWCYVWCVPLVYGMQIIKTFSGVLDSSEPKALENKWIVQKLDHFNIADKRTWKQVINVYYSTVMANDIFVIIIIIIFYFSDIDTPILNFDINVQ